MHFPVLKKLGHTNKFHPTSKKLPTGLKSSRMGQLYSQLYQNTRLIARPFNPVVLYGMLVVYWSLTNRRCGLQNKKPHPAWVFLRTLPEKQINWPKIMKGTRAPKFSRSAEECIKFKISPTFNHSHLPAPFACKTLCNLLSSK